MNKEKKYLRWEEKQQGTGRTNSTQGQGGPPTGCQCGKVSKPTGQHCEFPGEWIWIGCFMFIYSMNHLLLILSNIINPGNLLLDMSASTLIISCTNSIMFYLLDCPVSKIRQPSMHVLSFLLFGQNLLMLSERCICFQTNSCRFLVNWPSGSN